MPAPLPANSIWPIFRADGQLASVVRSYTCLGRASGSLFSTPPIPCTPRARNWDGEGQNAGVWYGHQFLAHRAISCKATPQPYLQKSEDTVSSKSEDTAARAKNGWSLFFRAGVHGIAPSDPSFLARTEKRCGSRKDGRNFLHVCTELKSVEKRLPDACFLPIPCTPANSVHMCTELGCREKTTRRPA